MLNRSLKHRVGQWLAVATLVGCSFAALAQTEPTLNQVYDAAQAGKLEQAQTMMQQVLVAHPNSGKAHFVQAELLARQGQLARASESLAMAEKLAPGLPFAKADAVQNLRTLLASKANLPATVSNTASARSAAVTPAAPASTFPLGLGLALGGAAIAGAILFMRKKQTPEPASQNAYANPNAMSNGLSGPQSFGMGNNMGGGAVPSPYGQPGYGQPTGSGLGGKVMGGLATGLAVGAGVMAAQAIGKSLMGNDDHNAHQADNSSNNTNNNYQPIASNSDLGGQNFGVNDAGSWDDGGSNMASSGDGGGDWDS